LVLDHPAGRLQVEAPQIDLRMTEEEARAGYGDQAEKVKGTLEVRTPVGNTGAMHHGLTHKDLGRPESTDGQENLRPRSVCAPRPRCSNYRFVSR
jgi:hypothetical protein